jgi:hypothetical protein
MLSFDAQSHHASRVRLSDAEAAFFQLDVVSRSGLRSGLANARTVVHTHVAFVGQRCPSRTVVGVS